MRRSFGATFVLTLFPVAAWRAMPCIDGGLGRTSSRGYNMVPRARRVPHSATEPRRCATCMAAGRAMVQQSSRAASRAAASNKGSVSSAAGSNGPLLAPFQGFFDGVASLLSGAWNLVPTKAILSIINIRDLAFFLIFQLVYKRAVRTLYRAQEFAWPLIFGEKAAPKPYDESVLGFLEPRLHVFSRVLALVYVLTGGISLLINCGWRMRPETPKVVSTIAYYLYAGYFVDEFKKFFLPVWLPELRQDKRKGFVYSRSSSVLLWAVVVLAVMEVISSFLRIPITSTLAFGGIGGLAFGLASKDVISNFFGGLMLLFSEPFTPGDMVLFRKDGHVHEGRVERVGWYQTRLRGRDTRPTYVPNGVFVESVVTNMDRITHRKFEVEFFLRYEDMASVPAVVAGLKAGLKELPKVDVLGSPFRVHLTGLTPNGLQIVCVCYFAIKSFDEFLFLQQMALLEVGKAVTENGCTLAYPLYTVDIPAQSIGSAIINGMVEGFSEQKGARMLKPATAAAAAPPSVTVQAPPPPPPAAPVVQHPTPPPVQSPPPRPARAAAASGGATAATPPSGATPAGSTRQVKAGAVATAPPNSAAAPAQAKPAAARQTAGSPAAGAAVPAGPSIPTAAAGAPPPTESAPAAATPPLATTAWPPAQAAPGTAAQPVPAPATVATGAPPAAAATGMAAPLAVPAAAAPAPAPGPATKATTILAMGSKEKKATAGDAGAAADKGGGAVGRADRKDATTAAASTASPRSGIAAAVNGHQSAPDTAAATARSPERSLCAPAAASPPVQPPKVAAGETVAGPPRGAGGGNSQQHP
ncbi:unnamed protein product [Phaeothamnion confervicola]